MADFDFAILGGGSAGYAGARTAVELGLKTVVIDGADELGGLCILRGCMPSKTLIESANLALSLRRAAEFGITAQAGAADPGVIRDRKRRLVDDFANYRRAQLEGGGFTLLRGTGRFDGAGADEVRLVVKMRGGPERTVSARTALIATGSVVNVPALPGLDEAGYWTSDTILDAAEMPESFILLGGGAIALEMAHYLEGIGRRVTLLQRNTQLLTGMDADVAGVVRTAFGRRGIGVHCGTRLLRVEPTAETKSVFFEQDGESRCAQAVEILLALGRRPALSGLGLDGAGIETDGSWRVVAAATQRTTHPRVFVAGDACGPMEVVHLAIQQGEIAARNAAATVRGESPGHELDLRCKLFGVFAQPQVAAVGLSEAEARSRGVAFIRATHPFDDHGKSLVMGETEGFVKLLAQPETGEILGGAVVGPEATELIHEIAVAMHLGATVSRLATAPHYHPTLSEIWTYPAEELAEKVRNRI